VQQRPTRIAVDAVGGDLAPEAVLEGVTAALAADPDLTVLLVGPSTVVEPYVASHPRAEAVLAEDTIGMQEHGAGAVRAKKQSSIVVGCRLVADGNADAFFSAGNTGAMMVAGTLVTGRLPGVMRPAIGTALPTTGDPCVMLDVGANADCKPEHLAQFAQMGRAYATAALGIASPRVALLNIGEEPTKGSVLAQEAYALMAASVPGFVGNVEGRDIPVGAADVIVTDGFTGNVALKLMEGLSKTLLGQVRDAMTSSAPRKVAAALLKPALKGLKDRLDPDELGAAPLLGLRGLVLIGHGSSGPRAVASAIRVGALAVRQDVIARVAASLAAAPPPASVDAAD
jgi:glycerol-3-phosphate acyltransferase PlsX